jgi:hypothetical protein
LGRGIGIDLSQVGDGVVVLDDPASVVGDQLRAPPRAGGIVEGDEVDRVAADLAARLLERELLGVEDVVRL